MEEIWKDIIGYEGLYKINNFGKIINNKGNEKQKFKRKCANNSSWCIALNKNSKTRSFKIDSLLYSHFNIDNEEIETINNEIWKDIKDFENIYQISNTGRIKSLDRYILQSHDDGILYQRFMKGKLLSLKRNNGNGYLNVQLREGNGSEMKNFYIHILVSQHFIDNPENKLTVNHKNGIKNDNRAENLEWATQSEQMYHAYKIGLRTK